MFNRLIRSLTPSRRRSAAAADAGPAPANFIPAPGGGPGYRGFTDRARKVMVDLAREEAHRLNHEYIGTEHLLLGLIQDDGGGAANVLKSLDVDPGDIRLEVEKLIQGYPLARLPQTPRAKKVVEYSLEETRNLKQTRVGTEDILLGLLREQEGVAAQVLRNLGLEVERVREEVSSLLSAHRVPDDELRDGTKEKPEEL